MPNALEAAAYAGRESEDPEHRVERERRRERERDGIEQRERQGARRDDRAGRAEEMKEEILVTRAGQNRAEGTEDPRAEEEETCAGRHCERRDAHRERRPLAANWPDRGEHAVLGLR